jgi:multimeric flavodoxin WrbA
MKALVLLGSRNPNGQTAQAVSALKAGLEGKGAQVETAFLPTLRLERCRQCDENGWGACLSKGRCVIEDDFARLVGGIRSADLVVFATPVYFSDLSESTKAFTDRLRRTCRHADGKRGIEGKRGIGICVAGGGGGGAPTCCQHLEKVLSTCGIDMLDLIPVRRQNLQAKLEVLTITGRDLAQ